MLLLVAIVQTTDAQVATDALIEQGLRVTRIGSMGGLLGIGNVALLMGLDESQYEVAVAVINSTCHTRLEYLSSVAMVDPDFPYLASTEVEVGGAVVFAIPVEKFVRIPRPAAADHPEEDPMTTPSQVTDEPATGDHDMKLIVAVVKGDDADAVIKELLDAELRLTRINTTGGFLRRGNATLLIGVEAGQVDEVIELVERACPDRPEASPIEKGLPMYSATIFVLDSAHFVRI
jgi:uncharacterized protein YaaQ